MGNPLGFALKNLGGCGRVSGSIGPAVLIAACTAPAAASISVSKPNSRVIREAWLILDDVISAKPEIRPSRRSSGEVNAGAIVSALAPGRKASTVIVGRSSKGNDAIGSDL